MTETLFKSVTSSTLMMATHAVAATVAAFASARNPATPGSPPLIVADEMPQTTPSALLGAELPWLIIKGVDVELRAERKADTAG